MQLERSNDFARQLIASLRVYAESEQNVALALEQLAEQQLTLGDDDNNNNNTASSRLLADAIKVRKAHLENKSASAQQSGAATELLIAEIEQLLQETVERVRKRREQLREAQNSGVSPRSLQEYEEKQSIAVQKLVARHNAALMEALVTFHSRWMPAQIPSTEWVELRARAEELAEGVASAKVALRSVAGQ